MRELMQYLSSSELPAMPILQQGQYACRRGEFLLQWFALLFPPSKHLPTAPFENDYPVFRLGRGEDKGEGMQVGLDMDAHKNLQAALETDRNLYNTDQEGLKAAWCGKLARGFAANLKQLRRAAYNTEELYELTSQPSMSVLNMAGLGLTAVTGAMLSRMNMTSGVRMVEAFHEDVFSFLQEALEDQALIWPAEADETKLVEFESYL